VFSVLVAPVKALAMQWPSYFRRDTLQCRCRL